MFSNVLLNLRQMFTDHKATNSVVNFGSVVGAKFAKNLIIIN